MQTLKIIDDGTEAQSITTDIVALVRFENGLSVFAVGEDAISQTISAIDRAKKLLKKEDILVNIKPILSEEKTQDNERKTAITFQIISAPLFVEIAVVTPVNEMIA